MVPSRQRVDTGDQSNPPTSRVPRKAQEPSRSVSPDCQAVRPVSRLFFSAVLIYKDWTCGRLSGVSVSREGTSGPGPPKTGGSRFICSQGVPVSGNSVPALDDFIFATLAAATRHAPGQPRLLNGRAWDVGERTVDAAITSVRPEQSGTPLAIVEKLARIGRHRLGFDVSALRTANRRPWFDRRGVSPPAHRVAIRAG
jgi:hypothetical protein